MKKYTVLLCSYDSPENIERQLNNYAELGWNLKFAIDESDRVMFIFEMEREL